MDKKTKELLKSTILGLVGGGSVAALYSLYNGGRNVSSDDDVITVPLSKRHYLSAVRGKEQPAKSGKTENTASPKMLGVDTSRMSPLERATLKRNLLREKAGADHTPDRISVKTGPVAVTTSVKNSTGINSDISRDDKGRFVAENSENGEKKAGVLGDAGDVMLNAGAVTGGIVVGMHAVKAIRDRIVINRKRKEVEDSKRRYADMLANEVNDTDLPYYSKSASDRSLLGSTLGYAGFAGAGTALLAGLITYRVLENRRKADEKALDKDINNYPADKIVKFKFAEAAENADKGFFG